MRKLLVLMCALLLTGSLHAQVWNGSASNDWFTAANWTPTGVPGASASVTIPNVVSGNYPVLTANVNIATLNVNGGQLNMAGYNINCSNSLSIDNATITGGGTISAAAQGMLNITSEILATSLSCSGITNSLTFGNNKITGNVSFTTSATQPTGTSNTMAGNSISGNLSINHASDRSFSLGVDNKDSVGGNLDITISGASTFHAGYTRSIWVNGNMTVNRTAAGYTSILGAGDANYVGGNLTASFTGGESLIGSGYYAATVAGKLNFSYTGPGNFNLRRVHSMGTGSMIAIDSASQAIIESDTLSGNITITRNKADNMIRYNHITGNVSIATSATQPTGTSNIMAGNSISGNLSINHASDRSFSLGVDNKDSVGGNLDITISGASTFHAGYTRNIWVNGDMTVNRTAAGYTSILGAGDANHVGGNLTASFTGGESFIGSGNYAATVAGKLNLTATDASTFDMRRIKNSSAGGTILLDSVADWYIMSDTLQADVTVRRISGKSQLRYSMILGDVFIGTSPAQTTSSNNLSNNLIDGNLTLVHQGSGQYFDSDGGTTHTIKTDSIVNLGSGKIQLGFTNNHISEGSLILRADTGISIGYLTLAGTEPAFLKKYGSQTAKVERLTINRSSTVPYMLQSPLTIGTNLKLMNGYLQSSAANPIFFANNTSCTGGADSSHIIGAIRRNGNSAFTFALGNGQYYSPLAIDATTSSTFEAQYINASPNTAGYSNGSHVPSLHHISIAEYWLLDRLNGDGTVKVKLGYGPNSGGVDAPDSLRIARWDGSTWTDEGNGNVTGNSVAGMVETADKLTAFGPLTFASVTAGNALPVTAVVKNSGILAGPNPVRDHLTLVNTEPALQGSAAMIINMQGQVVYRFTLKEKMQIHTAGWPAGIYLMRLENGQTIRLVKE